MASLVMALGVTHNPNLPGLIERDGDDPAIEDVVQDYVRLRQRLEAAQPDAILVVGSDHLNQWFTDTMPQFTVGKAPRARGPFPHETRRRGLAAYDAPIHGDLARHVLAEGLDNGVDMAFSDEFLMDHAFTVPLNLLRPQMDLPIVPFFTNVMAPPLATAGRFREVGRVLRDAIDRAPDVERVAMVVSGHLALDVGGPRPETGSADPDFDRRMLSLISEGRTDEVVEAAAWERLTAVGNATPGFLNFVLLLGAMGSVAPTDVALRFPRRTAAVPYVLWDLEKGNGS